MFMQFDNGQAMPAPAASDYHQIYDPLNGFSSRHVAVINQRHAQYLRAIYPAEGPFVFLLHCQTVY